MQNSDFNPYAPPTNATAPEDAAQHSAVQDYRIEKNVMILPPPFVLPAACLLTGARQGLQRCEIPLKVMPRRSNYLIVLMMFASQFLAFTVGVASQKFKPNLQLWFGSPLIGNIFSVFVSVIFAAAFPGVFFMKKRITLIGFWTNAESVFRRRRLTVLLVLIIDIVLVTGLLMTWLLFDGVLPLFVVTVTSVPFAFVLTWIVWLRNRKPWSRIGALQRPDGSLAVYGLDSSFLAVCRLGLDESSAPPATPQSA